MTLKIDTNRFESVLGDLEHKKDVIVHFARWDTDFLNDYISNTAQANWLKDNRIDLVPPADPAGNLPSDHQLGTIFEYNYFISVVFRHHYLLTLPRHYV